MTTPLITCVMVTGKSPDRKRLALQAIRSYLQQTYTRRELLIVNDADWDLGDGEGIREIKVSPRTLGELRNVGLEEAHGEWICQWDDDDYSHPVRLERQLAVAEPDKCVLLSKQVRYNFEEDSAFAAKVGEGIPGTILHPRTEQRYLPEGKHEDSHFWKDVWGPERRVLLTDVPWLYFRFYHGSNTWHARHVMQGRTGERFRGRWNLPREGREELRKVLEGYQ